MRFHSEISIVYGNAGTALTELTGRLVLEFEIARLLGRSDIVNCFESGADLVFGLSEVPVDWQFLIDIVPAQMAVESYAGR